MIETIKLRKDAGPPTMQIRIGNAHNGNFRVTALDEDGEIVSDTRSSGLPNLDTQFILADSAEQLADGIITWNIRVISNEGPTNDPYDVSVVITQDGQTVHNGKFPYSGNLNQGVKVIVESVSVKVE